MSDEELYRALLAERYGPSLWWTTKDESEQEKAA